MKVSDCLILGPPTPPTSEIEDDGGARSIGIESITSTTTEYSSTGMNLNETIRLIID